MDQTQLISLYSTLLYVSIGVAALGLIFAVFFFFFFDIPSVFAMMTGRAQQKTVERMNAQNSRTGSLRTSKAPESSYLTENVGATTAPIGAAHTIEETSVLSQEPETSTLSSGETATLSREAETSVLNADFGATGVLNAPPSYGDTMPLSGSQAAVPSVRFEVTEETISINTDELI